MRARSSPAGSHAHFDIIMPHPPEKSKRSTNADVVISNGSAKKRGRPWGALGKKKKNHTLPRGEGRRRKRKAHDVRKSCIMGVTTQPYTRKADIMSRRKYSIHFNSIQFKQNLIYNKKRDIGACTSVPFLSLLILFF